MPLLLHIPTDFPYTAELFQTTCTPAMRKCYQETRLPLKDSTNLPASLDGVSAPRNYTEMHRLLGDFPYHMPDSTVGHEGNMVKDGAVLFASEQGAKYGFTIRNSSAEDLFPYLFYFDPDDDSIQIWYSPNPRGSVPPLLKSGGTATVGMGTDRAFEFKLDPHLGQSQSSGFLKLFVTTEDTREVTSIQQTSPFEQGFPTNVRMIQSLSRVSKWDALTVALTMTAE
ncbi:hypothetical protein DFH08DRAFT_863521 [Mycena albidolilacea]|uniref:Uncharacterized protein n=1 Tax=Mycena albidolilacea TaxID=1033008 RepID=A0AAD7A5S4_9AGAR|nr:hypothetical protein DFH08DRAFT_863521 [Mycena albidolilacea]